MKKKLLLALVVSVLLVGCGSTDTTDNAQGTETPQTQEEQKQEETHTHAYTESITTDATCEADGVKTFTCECGDSYTEAITATGHNYEEVADSATPATCDTDGKEADTKCSLCDSVVEGAVIPASGHSYGEYVYNNDATTSADGTETATCSVCGGTDTRTKAGTKIAVSYDGYDEFGNGYTLDANGDKVFYVDCPYPLGQIVDNGSELYYYNIKGQGAKDMDCINILEDRYPGVMFTNDHREVVRMGYYNGQMVLFKRWFL